ncbi:kelch-like protein diablo [Homarus americanus]|uniref:kelch-like protein diablo n=1 Tax=Homarus americanus TaxID=6706 RepID=UPI001C43DE59|nr:kelch-like protein diablo [Homarus americanus]
MATARVEFSDNGEGECSPCNTFGGKFAEVHYLVNLLSASQDFIFSNFVEITMEQEFLEIPKEILLQKWQKVGPMKIERCGPGVAVLHGKIFVVGGIGGDSQIWADGEVYDPQEEDWTGISSMVTPRMGVVEHRGIIYIMGGYTYTYNRLRDLRLRDLLSYNPVTGEWKNLAPILGESYNTISVAVLNNFLYVVGGTEFEEMERYSFEQAHRGILSAGSDYFKTMFTCGFAEKTTESIEMKSMKPNILQLLVNFIYTGNMKITVENAQELIAAANMLMMSRAVCFCTDFLKSELHPSNALGIYRGYMDFYNPMHDLLSYNPVTGEWRALAGRAPPRYNYMGVAVLNNFFGRMDSYNPFHELLSYNPVTGEWRDLAALSAPPRYNYMGVAVLNNFLYLVGGLFNEEGEKSLERYSFEQNEWFKCSSMNFWRSIPAVVATNSLLYIIGGHRPNDHLELNQWFKCSSSEYLGRSSPAVVVTNSLLYVIGGYWSGLNGIGMVRKEE